MTRRHLTLLCVALLALAWSFLPDFTVTLFSYIALYALVAAGLVVFLRPARAAAEADRELVTV